MSNRHIDQAWRLRLKPLVKAVAVALADHANDAGMVSIERRRLMWLTGQSKPSVKRALRDLRDAKLLAVTAPATLKAPQQYQLYFERGVSQTLGVSQTRGVYNEGKGGSDRSVSDPLMIPKSNVQAAPPRTRLETPTPGQVTKLVHTIIDDPPEWIAEDGDLEEALKRACAKAHFIYDAAVVFKAVNKAVIARGGKPWLPLKGQVLR